MAAVLKTAEAERPPGVRIPLPPPTRLRKYKTHPWTRAALRVEQLEPGCSHSSRVPVVWLPFAFSPPCRGWMFVFRLSASGKGFHRVYLNQAQQCFWTATSAPSSTHPATKPPRD